ncbi:DUF3494 domain-containing protein [Runella sp. CRIBMP]|uniref:ice-binding family protein n=1 Tax=Runella sp. CRIBMP TaxID=2683261 RepID=UPI0014121BA2|nr:ice-binding family protein [Runella sp. CRIBMP]NBB22889.1 DUF3494 domain-containing protein [Runella sp. CRIBMP]
MKKNVLLILSIATLVCLKSIVFGQAPNLGTAFDFALFTANGAFTNTGASMVVGDIGTNVGAFSGFPPGMVTGNIRLPGSPEAAQAAIDVVSAYNSLNSRPCGTIIAPELAGQTLVSGVVYCQNTATPTTLNGTLTLSGSGIFIIKLSSALTTATSSSIVLINGATANNVFFQVDGAVTLGIGSVFKGTILAQGAIFLSTGASLEGRGLSVAGAITLNNNSVTNVARPLPVTLVSFTAKPLSNQTVDLAWTTSLETNNKGFLVERSKEMRNFEKVEEISEIAANSNSLKTYRLIDRKAYAGTSYYRLTQTDLSGKVTVYPAISVVLREDAYGVFPNPVVSEGRFTLRLDEPETALVNLYSMEGRLLPLQKIGVQSGNLMLKATGKMATGVYILSVVERGQTRNHRVVVE